MKKMTIRAIGILLIMLGAIKAYICLRVVVLFVPTVFEHGLITLGIQATALNLTMAAIGLAKVVGGIGLFWIKAWAKWTATVAASLHVVFLAYFGIPIWIKVGLGTLEWPEQLPMWRDPATIGVNVALVVVLFTFMKKTRGTECTTTASTTTNQSAPCAS